MMSEEDAMRERCGTCGKTRQWHKDNKPVHPFNDGQAGAKAFLGSGRDRDHQRAGIGSQRGSETSPTVVWPTDPVLRVALINAGVITADDLRSAEEVLKVSMGLEGSRYAEPPESARGREVQVGEAASVHVGHGAERGEEMGSRSDDNEG